MESWLLLVAFVLFLAFCAKFAVSFVLEIFKPRGQNLTITHQIKGVEANTAKEASRKAFRTLSTEQQKQVKKVYMNRED
jgi:hypothetical protein